MTRRPFKSNITPERIWNFTPGDPSTTTGSQLVDAVLETIAELENPTGEQIAQCLEIPRLKLSYAVEVCTGHNLPHLLLLLRVKRLRDAILGNLGLPMDDIARIAGFYDRAAAEKLMKNPKFAHLFADIDLKSLRPKRYYKSKVGEKKPPRYY